MEITNDRNVDVTAFTFYLGGDAYTAPAIWKEEFHIPSGQSRRNLYYLHRDYQGTILQITNSAGQIQENRLFDAWGNVLKITDAANNIVANFIITDRGYTGHEHLLSVGIIHMNGRLYDPLLHRFLSPDNYVQDPSNTQNFNRYGYVMNNPLTRIDPSGEFIVEAIIIGAAIFGYLGGVAANNGNFNPIKWDWSSGKTWAGIGIGAVAGGLGGWGFAVAGKALAASSFFTAFANGSIAAYGIAGTFAGAAAGYATGFGAGMVNSGGDWGYANRMGGHYAGIGAAVGSVAGTLYGFSEAGMKHLKNQPEYLTSTKPVNYINASMNGSLPSRYFEGVPVFGSEMGSLKYGAAFTLPGIGIFVNPNDLYNTGLLRHEYGHVLQAIKWGYTFFYGTIVPTSIKSANRANNELSFRHMDTWTEWSANYLSYIYFNYPKDWNMKSYPINPSTNRPGVYPPMKPSEFLFGW